MNSVRHAATLARFELKGVIRSRWFTAAAVVFAAAAIATSIAGLRSFASLGLAGAGAATDGLVHVTLLLPPLVGLLLGAGSLARDRERGLLGMLASQPVRRGLLPLSGFIGSVIALWAVIASGLGFSALLLSTSATAADLAALMQALTVGFAAAAAAVAIGVLIASVSSTYQQATAAAAALWLLLALGLDLLLAGVAPGLYLGPLGLLVAVIVNPLEAARVLSLLVLDGANAIGPFGSYLTATFGRSGSRWLLSGVITAWVVLPLAGASLATIRRDV